MQRVAIIGDTGAGKTCFLAVLRWLGEMGGASRFINIAADGETKRYFEGLYETLRAGRVPEGSAASHDLVFSENYVCEGGGSYTQFDFYVTDYRGADTGDVESGDPLLNRWLESDVLLVLVPVDVALNDGRSRDYLHHLANALTRLAERAHEKRLAVVLTQADNAEFTKDSHDSKSALEFLRQKLPDFCEKLTQVGFKSWSCFALASLGVEPKKDKHGFGTLTCDAAGPCLDTFGYEELFDWLATIKTELYVRNTFRRIVGSIPFKATLAIAICALIGIVVRAGVMYRMREHAKVVLESDSTTLEEKGLAFRHVSPSDRQTRFDEFLERFGQEVEDRDSVVELKKVIDKWDLFVENARFTESESQDWSMTKSTAKSRIEEKYFKIIQDLYKGNDFNGALDQINAYAKEPHKDGSHGQEIEVIRETIKQTVDRDLRLAVKAVFIGNPSTSAGMSKRLQKIREYANSAGPSVGEKERKEMVDAVEFMGKLCDKKQFTIKKICAKSLPKSLKCYFRIASDVQPVSSLTRKDYAGICVSTSSRKKGIEPMWSENEFESFYLAWEPGKPLQCSWYDDGWFKDDLMAVAVFDKNDWLALLRMLQPDCPMSHSKLMTITCEEFPEPERALQLVEKYVYPGTYWN